MSDQLLAAEKSDQSGATVSNSTIYSLAYISEVVDSFTREDLSDILEVSVERNSRDDITGLLIFFDAGTVIQILEGSEEKVSSLMEKIKGDPRHTDVKVFAEGNSTIRRLPDWSMAVRTESEIPQFMANSCKSVFRAVRNCPIMLKMTDERVDFFRSLSRLKKV